jgi:hypothetical protein
VGLGRIQLVDDLAVLARALGQPPLVLLRVDRRGREDQ